MNSVKEFWAIDFDRCIGNVDTLSGLFGDILQEKGALVDVEGLNAARTQQEAIGGSFDVLTYVERALSDDALYHELLAEYLRRAEPVRATLVNPGTYELFDYLDARSIPYGIVSYGNQGWQSLKIAAAGYSQVPYYILSHSRKGEIVANWQSAEGFVIPQVLATKGGLVSDKVVLVDDKAVSFTGLPVDARGYWVRPAQLMVSQKGSVPASVMTVGSLLEVVETEGGH